MCAAAGRVFCFLAGGGGLAGVTAPSSLWPQAAAQRSSSTVFVDRQTGGAQSAERVLATLRQLVRASLVLVDGRIYSQRSGIPQGSIASALLCCLHYGALDLSLLTNYLACRRPGADALPAAPYAPQAAAAGAVGGGARAGPGENSAGLTQDSPPPPTRGSPPASPTHTHTTRPMRPGPCADAEDTAGGSLLMRLIDDSLCVSTDAPTRDGFLTTMARGFESYGCTTGIAKTRLASSGDPCEPASLAPTPHGGRSHMPSCGETGAGRSHRPSCNDSLLAADSQCSAHGGRAPPRAWPSQASAEVSHPPTAHSAERSAATAAIATAGSVGGAGFNDPQDLRAPGRGPSAVDALGRQYFGWCGLLLNMTTCEVHPDMSRRRSPLSLGVRTPPRSLRQKLRAAVKPQLRAIFVDPTLNSALAVRRNLYHGLLHAISSALASTGRNVATQADFVAAAMRELVGFASRVVRNNQLRCVVAIASSARTSNAGGNGGGVGGRGDGGGGSGGGGGLGGGDGGGGEGAPGPGPAGRPPCSTLVEQPEVEWLAWTALATVLPMALTAGRTAALSRRRAVEASGRVCARSLELLRAAADARSLVTVPPRRGGA